MIVLVDRFSASASEIFAAAIQDYGRGIVVGQQTYGKGSVQNLYPLDRYALGPDPGFGQLTVTIGKYYRVTGESTQHRGVQPDISMPTAISTEEVGESTRESALPWDRIRPVDFGRETQIDPGGRRRWSRRTSDASRATRTSARCSPTSTRSRRSARRRRCRSISRRASPSASSSRRNAWRARTRVAPRMACSRVAKLADLTATPSRRMPTLAETAEIAADLSGVNSLYLSKLKTEGDGRETATP